MRIRPRARSAAVCALLAMVACTGGSSGGPVGQPSERTACEATFAAPTGFEATETFEVQYRDHVGVRLSFRDDAGRLLEYFAGVPGEFGEGLPLAGSVELASGERTPLIGKGEIWVIAWNTSGLCGSHAVLGNGFTRKEFVSTLEESGVIVPG